MTCGMSLLSNDKITIAADKKSSYFTSTGEFVCSTTNGISKIVVMKNNTAVFVGGLTEITESVKAGLIAKDEAGEVKTLDDVISEVVRLCTIGHNEHIQTVKKSKLPIGTVVCILAGFRNGEPVQLGFMPEFNFMPINFREKHRMLFKSSNDNLAADLLTKIASEANTEGIAGYMRKVFKELSKQEQTISEECDIYEVRKDSVKKLEGAYPKGGAVC